jgi:hypothetical protein
MPNQNQPNPNVPDEPNPDFGLRPPDVDQFVDDPDGYIAEMNCTREPSAVCCSSEAQKKEMKTEGTNPRGTIPTIPVSYNKISHLFPRHGEQSAKIPIWYYLVCIKKRTKYA